MRLSVLGYRLPSKTSDSIKDCVVIYDTKTGKTRPADSPKPSLKKTEKLVFSLALFVKDFSNLHSNQATVVHLVDADDSGSNFFPEISPADLLRTKAAQSAASDALELLQRFNVCLEGVVSVDTDGHFVMNAEHS